MLYALAMATEEGETPNPLIPAIYDIVWSLVPFAMILFLFWRVVLPAMQKILDARAELIEGGISKAENALEEYKKRLADARAEAAKIREQARLDGTKILNELKEQAQTDSARIVASAHAQIEAERQSAVVSLRSEVGSLAIDLASGVIGESLSDDKKAAGIVDRFLADLEADEKAKAGK
jgi:F-type H+-transporting ATPase subunit b